MPSREAPGASPAGTKEPSRTPRKLSPGPGLAPQRVAAHQLARIHQATIEIAAEHGYHAVKVREVVRQAEVSTRAFYEHFGSKEDCFLQAYDLISRRATRRIIAAQVGEADWRKRARLVFGEFVRQLEKDPAAARLALIEVYASDQAAMDRAWRAERSFEGMLVEALARGPKGVAVPPLIVQGVVAGIATVSRNRLLLGDIADLANNGGELVDWAMCYPSPAAAELSNLDRQSVWRDTTLEPLTTAESGDRALILDALARLGATTAYADLTPRRVRAAAGVSKRKFDAQFDDLEDCWLAAFEQRTGEALAQAARAQTAAAGPAGGVYRAIAALSDYVVNDPFLARVCLTGDSPGPGGLRSSQRFIDATMELVTDSMPAAPRPPGMIIETSAGAVWSLFRCRVLQDRLPRYPIAATLTYLALAPTIGASAAVEAIQREQAP